MAGDPLPRPQIAAAAGLPPLTILWTRREGDVKALTPKIVKDGTSDQLAVLLTGSSASICVIYGQYGWAEIRNPKSEI